MTKKEAEGLFMVLEAQLLAIDESDSSEDIIKGTCFNSGIKRAQQLIDKFATGELDAIFEEK